MKSKKNVINSLCDELQSITNKLAKINKFICKELDNITEEEQKQILKERKIQIKYFNILIERINTEAKLFLEQLKSNNTEDIVEENRNNCWIIYTDDPQFEGKRNYFKKYLTEGVFFTDEMPNAKKYTSFSETLKDMDILKIKYGIECFAKNQGNIQNE